MYILKRKLLVHINIITSITCAKDLSNILRKFFLSLLYFFLRQLLFVTIIFIAVTSNNKKRTKKIKDYLKWKIILNVNFISASFCFYFHHQHHSSIPYIHPLSQELNTFTYAQRQIDRRTISHSVCFVSQPSTQCGSKWPRPSTIIFIFLAKRNNISSKKHCVNSQ